MAKFSIFIGVILIAIGFVAYSGADKAMFEGGPAAVQNADAGADGAAEKKSMTAMIPAFFGFPILILGTLAMKSDWRRHAMHGVAILALLGTGAGLGRGLSKLGGFMSASDYASRRPVLFTLVMGTLCLVLLIGCILSFMAAKRKRLAESAVN